MLVFPPEFAHKLRLPCSSIFLNRCGKNEREKGRDDERDWEDRGGAVQKKKNVMFDENVVEMEEVEGV